MGVSDSEHLLYYFVSAVPSTNLISSCCNWFSLSDTTCIVATLDATNSVGTPWEGLSTSLDCPNASDHVTCGTVPNCTPIWGTASNAAVAVIPYGSGAVIYLGFDFFNAGPTCPQASNSWVTESTEAVSSTKVTGLDMVPICFVLTTCKKETLGWDSHIRLESPEVFLYKRMMIWFFSCVIFVWLFGIDLISFLQWIDWCCYTIIKSWFNARWHSWRGVW